MPIAITCSSCKRKLKAPDDAAGRKLKCPQCGSSIQVPEEDTEAEAPAVRQEKRPVKKRARIVEDDEERDVSRDDDSTEDEKPSRTLLYLAIGGSCALILTVTIVMILVMGGKTNKNDADGVKQVVQATPPQGSKGTDESGSSKEQGGNPDPMVPPAKKGIEPKVEAPPMEVQPKKTPAPPVVVPLELIAEAEIQKALKRAKTDEFYLFDLNKSGMHSSFSSSNSKVTLKNNVAQITNYKMCILFTKYDFDAKVFQVQTCVNITETLQRGKTLILLPDFYLDFAIPATAEEARTWSELFKQRKLKMDVVFRIKNFKTFEQLDSVEMPLKNTMVYTETVSARFSEE